MSNLNSASHQQLYNNSMAGSPYVTIDGLLKYCITAPLLELPIDFKEWYKQRAAILPILIQANSLDRPLF